MESKVTKNTADCRVLSINLLSNSVAIKSVLQQQILASIVSSRQILVITDLPDNVQIRLETIPVHRLSENMDVVYHSAIALKLSPFWQLSPLTIANQLMDSIEKINHESTHQKTGMGNARKLKNCLNKIQDDQQIITPEVHPDARSSEYIPIRYHPSSSIANCQEYLDFNVEILLSGWMQFRLSDRSLATWLQRLIQIPSFLSDFDPNLFIGFPNKGGQGEGEKLAQNTHTQKLKITPNQQQIKRAKTARQLFEIQYAHARCCSLLRLADRQGLITLSDPDFTTRSWHFVEPTPIPWLYCDSEIESEPMRLRLGHPTERSLIAEILDGIDQLSSLDLNRALKRAATLSHRFEQFYIDCRIWGEVKVQTPELAKARLGLIGITQKLLQVFLQDLLSIAAPVEL